MATVHHDATIVPTKLELLVGWMPQQRWYATKGAPAPTLTRVGGFRFEDPEGEVGIETVLVAARPGPGPGSGPGPGPGPVVVYQVPLTYRAAPLEGAEHALVGTMEHSVLGRRWVYDAPHDPVYVAALVETILKGGVSDDAESSHGSNALAHGATTAHLAGTVASSTVLTGEQSNTSVICRMAALGGGGPAEPLIVKVFRTLQHGDNPDVVIQTALTEAGSDRVPLALGHLRGAWDSPDGGAEQHGHLAFAQEFIPGVEDAWRVALVAASAGRDFSARARELGAAVAEIHESLARALGVTESAPAARARLVAEMHERYAAALAEVPDLASRSDQVSAIIDAARDVEWPALQRIHGDLHLGQVLDVAERGWVALDFEGEPMRPLAERVLPDLRMRDVAGMLRSFDYAAGSVRLATGADASEWAEACRAAFVGGYASLAGELDDAALVLLRALELDKALYEVVYEARNRPAWLPIPLGAVDRLLGEAPA